MTTPLVEFEEDFPVFQDEEGQFELMGSELMGGAPLGNLSAREKQAYIDGIGIKAKVCSVVSFSLNCASHRGKEEMNIKGLVCVLFLLLLIPPSPPASSPLLLPLLLPPPSSSWSCGSTTVHWNNRGANGAGRK